MRLLVRKLGFSNPCCHFSLQEQKPTRKGKRRIQITLHSVQLPLLTQRERCGPLTSNLLEWNLIVVKSASLRHCKNTEITDVSTFAFYCYFITDAPKGSREKKYFFDLTENFLMHFK